MAEPHYSAHDAATALQAAGYVVEQRTAGDPVRWHLTTPSGDTRAATDALLVALARTLSNTPAAAPAPVEDQAPAAPRRPGKRRARPQDESPRPVVEGDPRLLGILKTSGYINVAQDDHGTWTADHPILRAITAPTLPSLVRTAQMRLDQARFALLGTPLLHPDLPRDEIGSFLDDQALHDRFPDLTAWFTSFRDHERGEP